MTKFIINSRNIEPYYFLNGAKFAMISMRFSNKNEEQADISYRNNRISKRYVTVVRYPKYTK